MKKEDRQYFKQEDVNFIENKSAKKKNYEL